MNSPCQNQSIVSASLFGSGDSVTRVVDNGHIRFDFCSVLVAPICKKEVGFIHHHQQSLPPHSEQEYFPNSSTNERSGTFSRFHLFPTSALVVVVGAAEAFVAPGLGVPQVAGTVPRAGVQAGVDL